MDLLEHWEKKVGYKIDEKSGCWNAYGSHQGNGYVSKRFKIDGKTKGFLLHRVSYMLFVGSIPDGNIVSHTCYNKRCVNPKHLKASTMGEFAQDILRRETNESVIWEPKQKLTIKQTVEIRRSDLSSYKLAKLYNISPVQVRRIKNGSRCSGIK